LVGKLKAIDQLGYQSVGGRVTLKKAKLVAIIIKIKIVMTTSKQGG
jgi:hypothetical protein